MSDIPVVLNAIPGLLVAEAWGLPTNAVALHASSYESYEEALANLRRGIAYLGVTGKMVLDVGFTLYRVEEELDAAFALPDEELTITPADVWWAQEGEELMRRIAEGEEPGPDPEGGKEGERPSDPAP